MPRPSAYYAPDKQAAAKPARTFFDPWNSSSTGHQTAPNRLSGSTSWRDSRTAKLAEQFASGQGGGRRIFDTIGAGSEDFGNDGRLENGAWTRGASGLRKDGQLSLAECFAPKIQKPGISGRREADERIAKADCGKTESHKSLLFRNLNFYINGSTYPLISDHKLRRILVENGGNLSIALGRRTVTHVIVGTPSGAVPGKRGAGGGLASGKIQKEIASIKGAGIKFVSAEWVIQSIKQGKRLPEAKFTELKLATKGQPSILGTMGTDPPQSAQPG